MHFLPPPARSTIDLRDTYMIDRRQHRYRTTNERADLGERSGPM
jgi:hypothetical protein